jgi:tetratricopeptide (TPR) repeat protein
MKRLLPLFLAILIALTQSCSTLYSKKDMAGEYFTLAEAYCEVKKYDKAIVYYEKAATSREYSNAAKYGLARSYALTGNWDGAVKILVSLLKRDPDNKALASSYAFALVSSARMDEALTLYKILWEKYPDDSVMARNYAEMLFIAKKYDETTAQIALIKEQFPDTEGSKNIAALEKKIKDATAPKKEEGEGSEEDKGANADESGSGDGTDAPPQDAETEKTASTDKVSASGAPSTPVKPPSQPKD